MSIRKARVVFICKLLVAALALVALAALAGRGLAPSLTFGELLLFSAAGVVGVIALLIVGAVCSLQFSQFILRKGGTDAQWFWFPSEPKGLAGLREQQAEEEAARDRS
jgi:hypothetical protein